MNVHILNVAGKIELAAFSVITESTDLLISTNFKYRDPSSLRRLFYFPQVFSSSFCGEIFS